MKTQNRIVIICRRKSDPKAARRMGYTKNHFMVEAFLIGKWRVVGFYTPHQMAKGAPEARVQYLLKTNAGGLVADEVKWEEQILA